VGAIDERLGILTPRRRPSAPDFLDASPGVDQDAVEVEKEGLGGQAIGNWELGIGKWEMGNGKWEGKMIATFKPAIPNSQLPIPSP
jgi:hypothetical protein